MIYKGILTDKQNEIDDTYKDLEEKKKAGMVNLRQKSNEIKNNLNNFDKNNEIARIKSEIAEGIKNKIITSLSPRTSSKRLQFGRNDLKLGILNLIFI
jgi:hypothetical protein